MGAALSGQVDIAEIAESSKFSEKEVAELYVKFKHDYPLGYMTKSQFEVTYSNTTASSNRLRGKKLAATRMFKILDSDGNGTIDFREFIMALSLTTRGTIEEKTLWVYDICDIDRDGHLSIDEVSNIVRSIQTNEKDPKNLMGDRQIHDLFKEFDKNGDGTLTREEFLSASKSNPKLMTLITAYFTE